MSEKKEKSLAAFYFHQGTNFYAADYMGFHTRGKTAVVRVWAPNAERVTLCGDFNGWDQTAHPFKRVTEQGVWQITLPRESIPDGTKYKFAITRNGITHLKSDPYAFRSETLEKTASVVGATPSFEWTDAAWMRYRKRCIRSYVTPKYSTPMNIYEMHLASWRTRDGKANVEGDAYLNYREIADLLVPYVKKMGYTHVELMPITEYPYDGSWGYQVCSYYSPTSRFGTPEDFMYFVNTLHGAGIGVILDWVPAHFPKDEHGLYEFDGGPLYEYQGWDRQENKGWGTRYFDVARNEVQCFLISNALFWIEKYHIDGLRIDAVASMLYLDYDKKPGEWIPNQYGDNKNLEAIAFFKKLNSEILSRHSDVLMIAEESTAWSKLTSPPSDGGLGFNFKWNMGWANDMFDYVQTDPLFRKNEHNKLNFSMMYAFNENYILPVSHDEVVHGKLSLIDKMFGSYEDKFRGFRTFMAHMMAHPGKKMLFMGCEYGQFREWDYENQLEWFMTDYPKHAALRDYVAALNDFYLKNSELWYDDFSWDGFRWVLADEGNANLLAYERRNGEGGRLLCVFNFSGSEIRNYPLPMPDDLPVRAEDGGKLPDLKWKLAFSTELPGTECLSELYGVSNGVLNISLPPLSAVYLRPERGSKAFNNKRKK